MRSWQHCSLSRISDNEIADREERDRLALTDSDEDEDEEEDYIEDNPEWIIEDLRAGNSPRERILLSEQFLRRKTQTLVCP